MMSIVTPLMTSVLSSAVLGVAWVVLELTEPLAVFVASKWNLCE
jgi:hypothetical protein